MTKATAHAECLLAPRNCRRICRRTDRIRRRHEPGRDRWTCSWSLRARSRLGSHRLRGLLGGRCRCSLRLQARGNACKQKNPQEWSELQKCPPQCIYSMHASYTKSAHARDCVSAVGRPCSVLVGWVMRSGAHKGQAGMQILALGSIRISPTVLLPGQHFLQIHSYSAAVFREPVLERCEFSRGSITDTLLAGYCPVGAFGRNAYATTTVHSEIAEPSRGARSLATLGCSTSYIRIAFMRALPIYFFIHTNWMRFLMTQRDSCVRLDELSKTHPAEY